MTPAAILALINQYVVSNGVGSITGPILNNILTQIVNLFSATPSTAATRIVSASSTLNVLTTDQAIALQRNFSLSAMTINLPAVSNGQTFTIEDVVGNLFTYPATVTPPAGQTIAGRANFVMNEDFQSMTFRYYGSNLWSVG